MGSQSVVAVYDVRRRLDGCDYDVCTHNGRITTGLALTAAVSQADMGRLVAECGVVGAATGSLFVFKGSRKAVLINYPGQAQKDEIVRAALTRPRSGQLPRPDSWVANAEASAVLLRRDPPLWTFCEAVSLGRRGGRCRLHWTPCRR